MLTQLSHRLTTPVVPEKTTMSFGPRRGLFINAAERMAEDGEPLDADTIDSFETLDLFYRTLCAVMYNYAPLSGHPGGSISSGRFVARLVFDVMDYDLSQPAAKGCRHHFLCGRAQGARPLCDVGFAQ